MNPEEKPIQSHVLDAVGFYLARRREEMNKLGVTSLPEGDALLESLFVQWSILMRAINSSLVLSNDVGKALKKELARMAGEEIPEEPPSNIIVPDQFRR